LKKKRTSKSINNTNHDQQTDNPQDYQIIGSIDYSEKQKEHAIIARDIAYWTSERFDHPEEDTAYYRTAHDAALYPEAQAMIDNEDGHFEDTWWNNSFSRNRKDHAMEILFLNRKGKTQSANPQGQETKAKITSPIINATSSRQKVIKQTDKRHGPATQAKKTPAPITNRNIPKGKAKLQTKKVSHMSNKKWQNQAPRQFISNWTQHQMDAYLAIPQVAMRWIVEPG
jgi:hypothetical protein